MRESQYILVLPILALSRDWEVFGLAWVRFSRPILSLEMGRPRHGKYAGEFAPKPVCFGYLGLHHEAAEKNHQELI